MPWTPSSFKKKHWKAATPVQAKRAAEIANDTLQKTGDEGRAIRTGISVAKRKAKKRIKT